MSSVRLTMAQALVRVLSAQWTQLEGRRQRLFAGTWAIFGHGNVAALGEALQNVSDVLPTFRAHNEQAMAHAAIAFAKATRRRRMMACTTSIGPGATNLTTAAALAHVNRLPVLLLPGDVFASRRPDPVLQQVEDFGDGLVTANDCLRPVSRYFDRLSRPEQLLTAMDRALQVLTDPAECGPVTLGLCQDVQAEGFDWPTRFFEEREWPLRRRPAAESELVEAARTLRSAKRPVLVCGGGVLYSEAEEGLLKFIEQHSIPVVETQAGKSALPASHSLNLGAVGVTGTTAANNLIDQADVILAVGTRLQDFTTGSGKLIRDGDQVLIGLNVQRFDAFKFGARPLLADAQVGLRQLSELLGSWAAPKSWTDEALRQTRDWERVARTFTAPSVKSGGLPSDAQVIGAVNGNSLPTDIVVCAAGGLPGELHKHWRAGRPGGYHLEYGYSCMGYEIAGGLGVKLAQPEREVIVMVGDGSYLMMNSEIATSIQLDCRLIIVLLDNRGFGCIERLQGATGNASFNNLLSQSAPRVDFAAHAGSLGAKACHVSSLDELREAIATAREAERTSVIVIETDPRASTSAGGHWWDVAVPEVSQREEVRAARSAYDSKLTAIKPKEG
jgi:3D-(3,5/4)-trihydroxycyclohexane-1,2-dione acylhydrolase (decyclizing)